MNARGFTLIEIIVTIILMAIMGFMAIFHKGNVSFFNQNRH